MEIKGKVAVVTGGASGLGKAIVEKFVAEGGRAAIFDLNEAAGKTIVSELGDQVIYVEVNVTDEASVMAGIAETMKSFGAIHVCVNCAGIGSAQKTYGKQGPFPLAEWSKVIAVNLTGSFNVLRLCAEQMAKNDPVSDDSGRGLIINTASVAAFEGQIGQAAYSASKGGIVGMTLPIARDLASLGIRVNTIVPGLIDTPLFETVSPEIHRSLSNSVLNPKRLGKPSEIAHLVAALVENDYINGECIRIDGGIRMQPR